MAGRKILLILKRKTATCKAAGRKEFRRRNTNLLFGFHSLSGLAQLLFNHRPSSLCSRLKTFGLLSRSAIMQHAIIFTADLGTISCQRPCCILFVIKNHKACCTKYFLFYGLLYISSRENLSRPCSQSA